tara:strand:+ start:6460 stop:7128 length:669 start_codon:yes stop_codon:yes gene_type:complete
MITNINKNPKKLKIGLLGFRSNYLINPLHMMGFINFKSIEIDDIDESYDLVVETGVYNIISNEVLNKPKYGTIGFHESPLPEGRGHAPIQWAILNKKNNFTITLYKLDNGVDTGNIIYQYNIPIDNIDTYEKMEEKRKIGIENCFTEFLKELSLGVIVEREQTGKSSYHKKRNPEDSLLDDSKSLIDLWDNIRVCDNKNYPAHFFVDGRKVILRYEVVDDNK